MNSASVYAGFLIALLAVIMFGVALNNVSRENSKLKAEAIERGYAEWYTGKNNMPEWRWKGDKTQVEKTTEVEKTTTSKKSENNNQMIEAAAAAATAAY